MASLSHQIVLSHAKSMLLRSAVPQVAVRSSMVNSEHAGLGVFALEAIPVGAALCLYPGLYTPPVPFVDSSGELVVFGPADDADTSYVMNLTTLGGFIDGGRLDEGHQKGSMSNPLAIGHRINHPPRGMFSNVNVVPFKWSDLRDFVIANNSAAEQYPIPNARRQDGSPWYFCPFEHKLVRHPTPSSIQQEGESLAGALLVASAPVDEGSELFLDYALRGPPYPIWAEKWYCPAEFHRDS